MSKGNISKKQEEILEYIKSQILQRGFPPAVREICDAVNLKSTSSVHSHLETLEKNVANNRRTDTYDVTQPNHVQSRFWMIHLISQDVRWFRFRS